MTHQLIIAEPSLTVNTLKGVMEKVKPDKETKRKVWGKLLTYNGYTPDSYLDVIDILYQTEKDKTSDLADVYINSHPDSSRKHLVIVLKQNGEQAAAEEAESFLHQNGG